jgi:hypothetical protein
VPGAGAEHAPVLQEATSNVAPGQSSPPFEGAGLSQVRLHGEPTYLHVNCFVNKGVLKILNQRVDHNLIQIVTFFSTSTSYS